MNSQDWLNGNQAAWRHMLSQCIRQLGDVTESERWTVERADTELALRYICQDLGIPDNWPPGLHLGDVVEKYVQPYVTKRVERNYIRHSVGRPCGAEANEAESITEYPERVNCGGCVARLGHQCK